MRSLAPTFAVALALGACQTTTQTTSGADYLAARPGAAAPAAPAGSLDRAVQDAARAEPLLRFPARLGLARVHRGQVTGIPAEEAEAWLALAQRLGPAYGEFVPVSPLVTEMSAVPAGTRSVVDRLRIGAARQHVDAVSVYEVQGRASDRGTAFSLLDVTIIGAYLLPTRMVAGQAVASALLIDVRNGYPYGTATARGEASGVSASVGSFARSQTMREDAETVAVRNLTGEVGTMVARLRAELEQRDAAQAPPSRRREFR